MVLQQAISLKLEHSNMEVLAVRGIDGGRDACS